MLDAGLVSHFLAKFTDLARKCNGTVFASGTAHRDHKLALALLDIQRQRIFQHGFDAAQQFLRLLAGHHIIHHRLVQTGEILQFRHIERVGQAAHIKHDVRLLRQTKLESKGHDVERHRALSLLQEQTAHPLLVLRGAEKRGVDDIFGALPQRLQNFALHRNRVIQRDLCDDSQGMLAAGLLVAAADDGIAGIQKQNIIGRLFFVQFRKRGLHLLSGAQTAAVHHHCHTGKLVLAL